ncbi:MAG: RNase adapter RapZ [Gammaproteobacteria bacterium]
MAKLIFVSGISGSGKTVALHMLEDLGFYCMDNIPAGLLQTFVKHTIDADDSVFDKTAVGIDARNRATDISHVPNLFARLRELDIEHTVIFLHAGEAELLTRYSETRRKHPLSRDGIGLREALEAERLLLDPISREAHHIIDTSETSVHDLREIVRSRVAGETASKLTLQIGSFGFKNGVPSDADFVFDVRFLPNPYWDKNLRAYNGRDTAVIEFFKTQQKVAERIQDIIELLEKWLPDFEANNRSYLTVAIGCTGGQHRSVYVADQLTEHFAKKYDSVSCRHSALG